MEGDLGDGGTGGKGTMYPAKQKNRRVAGGTIPLLKIRNERRRPHEEKERLMVG